jgi:sulfhydrogenase subunit gamma (sulfur reductase)
MENTIYLPEPARVVKTQQLTAQEKLFTVEFVSGRSMGHQPGQFVEVSVLGVGEAPFVVSSSPSRSNGTFELCIRKAGDLTGVIHTKQSGDILGVRGPFGRAFPMEKFRGKDILFAPGGMGLPPARSVINQVLDERGRYGRVIDPMRNGPGM